jgi:hypothetical protein
VREVRVIVDELAGGVADGSLREPIVDFVPGFGGGLGFDSVLDSGGDVDEFFEGADGGGRGLQVRGIPEVDCVETVGWHGTLVVNRGLTAL